MLGSVDANRNDHQSGWDTDQFPNNAAELVPALYFILKSGGLGAGGFNFNSKVRRQSIDPEDLLLGHIGGIDVCAAALVAAARLIEDGKFDAARSERYAGWDKPEGQGDAGERRDARNRRRSRRRKETIDPKPRSGRQEWLREPAQPVSLSPAEIAFVIEPRSPRRFAPRDDDCARSQRVLSKALCGNIRWLDA